jgi:threonine dehydratase
MGKKHLAIGVAAACLSATAALAAVIQEQVKIAGRRIAVILSGGNVDRTLFAAVLRGGQPQHLLMRNTDSAYG